MKLIFVFLFTFFSLKITQAQQVFQGSIVYSLHAPQEKTDPELTVMFGPNKIKVKFKEKEDYDKTYLLIDFDSAKFYTVNVESKSFQTKKLIETANETVAASKTIAGYTTNSVNVTGSGLSGLVGFSGNTILYTAQDLYFPIPKKYASAPQLVMINNDHIVLGAEVSLALPGMGGAEIPDSLKSQMKVTVEAKQVRPETFDLFEFIIPNDFTAQNSYRYPVTGYADDSTAMDSIDVMMDTTKRVSPVSSDKPTGSKPSQPKKTTPTKSEATKPKKTQTKT